MPRASPQILSKGLEVDVVRGLAEREQGAVRWGWVQWGNQGTVSDGEDTRESSVSHMKQGGASKPCGQWAECPQV